MAEVVRSRSVLGFAAGFVLCLAGALAVAGGVVMSVLLPEETAPPEAAKAAVETAQGVLYDEWNERVSRDNSWRTRGNWESGSASNRTQRGRSNVQGPPPAPNWFVQPTHPSSWFIDGQRLPGEVAGSRSAPGNGSSRHSSGVRTLCVRLCDGSFFPISFGTHEGNFSRDQATCSNSCPGARLFYYKPGRDDPEDMVDTNGQPYSKLPNANLFRTQYVESCKCKPHPWEQASVERHRLYALEDQRRRGDRSVVAELQELKGKVKAEKNAATRSERRRSNDRGRQSGSEVASATAQSPAGLARAAARPITAGPITAPRSDASRGQGGPSVVTGSIAAAASAVTVQAVTAASAASAVPPSQNGAAAAHPASLTRDDPMPSRAGPAPAIAPASAPDPTPQPQPIIAQPFEGEPAVALPTNGKKQRKSARRDRSGPGGNGDMMRLGRNGDSPRLAPPSRRPPDWTRTVFGQ